MTGRYYRPVLTDDPARPQSAQMLFGGRLWFDTLEVLSRYTKPGILPAGAMPESVQRQLTSPRSDVAGLSLDRPRIMGILNTTPDSFSDGGRHKDVSDAVAAGAALLAAGCDVLDIGGESTRPGADEIPVDVEIERTIPLIAALRARGVTAPISIDTRKATVASAALDAGATLVNDVSGLTFDPDMVGLCAAREVPVCLMHMRGTPATMQDAPHYDDVLLDVFDFLAARIAELEAAGIPRTRILADPGIGFGKTQRHNLALLQRVSLFHALGAPLLIGASRKGFIGRIGTAPDPADRAPGSIAVALASLAQGVHMVRVHDVAETRQAIALWQAVHQGGHGHG